MPISFSLFPHAEAGFDQRRSASLSWDDFVSGMSEWEYRKTKLEASLLLPVAFREGAGSRRKEEVDSVFLASLDVDGVSFEEADAVEAFIREQGYRAFIYSTWRNPDSANGIGKKGEATEPHARLRVLLPLSRPVPAHQWGAFWHAYNEHFFHLADESCKDPSRGYFVPALPVSLKGKDLSSREAFFRKIEGTKDLDVDWLLAGYVSTGQVAKAAAPPSKGTRVGREQLVAFARSLTRRKARPDLQEIGYKILKGMKGEIFEAPGNRDTTVFKMAKEIAQFFPDGSVEDLSGYFVEALAAMEEEEPGAPTAENFAEKLTRAQAEVRAERAEAKRKEEAKAQAAEQQRKKLESSGNILTESSLEEFLRRTGQSISVEDFKFIVAHRSMYYLFTQKGFVGPFTAPDLILACKQFLEEPAKGVGFELEMAVVRDEGPPKLVPKTKEQLLREYGAITVEIRYNYRGVSYYDYDTSILHLSRIAETSLSAEEVPEVDAWITKAFGPKADMVRDWLAQATDLSRPLSALCIAGPADAGKSAFAKGVARLWGAPVVPMRVAMGDFNADILNSPVAFADEDLPRDYKGRVKTEELRSLISEGIHSVNSKGLPRVALEGFLRCIVALNNIENFNFGNAKHSALDVEAIQKRFVVVEVLDPSVRKLFKYKLFVEENGIARHALWLKQHRERKSDRFGVETGRSPHVVLADDAASMILDHIVDKLFNNKPLLHEDARKYTHRFRDPLLLAPGKKLLVSSRIYEDLLMEDKYWKRVNRRAFMSVLTSIAPEQIRVSLYRSRNQARFHVIDSEVLYTHIARSTEEKSWERFSKYMSIYHDASYLGGLVPTAEQAAERERAIFDFNMERDTETSDEEFESFGEVAE
jgi:hypothetical protein